MATYLSRSLATNNSGKMTLSYWIKRGKLGEQAIFRSYYNNNIFGAVQFNGDNKLYLYDYRNAYDLNLLTSMRFLDTSAWYHVVQNFDSTTSPTTAKIYVNGVEQALDNNTLYSQGATSSWLQNYTFYIGQGAGLGSVDFEGCLSDVYFIQGQCYDASTFGSFDSNGVWKPNTSPTIDYSSTGSNSFHLKFENSSNIALDSGDNNVSFTKTGDLTQTIDTPSNVFCTMNRSTVTNGYTTLSNANLRHRSSAPANWLGVLSTYAVNRGKWYAEVKVLDNLNVSFGIGTYNSTTQYNMNTSNLGNLGRYSDSWGLVNNGGSVYFSGNSTNVATSATVANNSIWGIAFDADNGKIYFSKNGSWVDCDPSTGTSNFTSVTSTLPLAFMSGLEDGEVAWNFGQGYFSTTAVASGNQDDNGQGIFEYAPPTGYYALCTKNLATYG